MNEFPPGKPSPASPFLLQMVGYKNSGKTTLATELIRRFKHEGYIVGTVKHDAHDFATDRPGTDTWRHQEAGADITAISSSRRSAVLRSSPSTLPQLLAQMGDADIVLIEGYKAESHPKLVLIRDPEDVGLPSELTGVAAVVAWPSVRSLIGPDRGPRLFELGETEAIYRFVRSLMTAKPLP